MKIIRPQEGFQEEFLASAADIAIGGGSAGGGKTFVSIIEPIRHKNNAGFRAIFFRRTSPQITNAGGLWDESNKIYPSLNAKSNETDRLWTFKSGATVKMSHLQYEKDVFSHQGSQYALIVFDEVTHFTENQFWYMVSRNRSTCGVRPYIRATCNPDPDSFIARLIEWWIDPITGFPIPERSGKLRYFIRDNGNMIWGDTKDEVIAQAPYIFEKFGPEIDPYDLIKSITFIPGSIYENKALLQANPEYLANLMAQDETIKAQLLDGNWKIRTDNLSLFDYSGINDVFTNFIQQPINIKKYITCDAARFGRDLCVVMAWHGWEVVGITIIKKSDVHDIISAIEDARKRFNIQKSNTLIDQDGVGAGTVRMGGYLGFSGGDVPKKVKGLKENYKNLKTQCFYYLAQEKVNTGAIKINVNNECCIVDGVRSSTIKMGSKVVNIADLIKADLQAIKRKDPDNEGKFQINTKEEQKNILGRSPDFGDTLMMRSFFDFRAEITYL